MKHNVDQRASTARHSWFLDDSFTLSVLINPIFLIDLDISLPTGANVACKH